MKHYKQLIAEDRIEIYAMLQAGKSLKFIATVLGVHPSTVSRELKRNTGLRGYRPKQAQVAALYRRHTKDKAIKMTAKTINYIESQLILEHSPEQISQRMKRNPDWDGPTVSHETIYQHIWKDKDQGGTLYKHLRVIGVKQKRKRRNSKDLRGQIKNRIPISQRPEIVEKKIRIGDWEADTVVGKNHKGALVTLTDRKSKLTLIGKVDSYTAQAVEQTMVDLLENQPRKTYTITVDNGKEFAGHENIAKRLKTRIYFADPYSPWQRGLNENTNGLIRQYVPKGSEIRCLTEEKIIFIQERLNNRPRKTLDYATPNEIYYKNRKIIV